MIHQFIFAGPKPGMSVEEFQYYWTHVHAVKYASKISQIRRYMICNRIAIDDDIGAPPLPHQGVAEIWLRNDQEQLASLQSSEFLEGARLDEPRWAAFWLTLVLDTTAHVVVEGPPLTSDSTWVKLFMLIKRRPGIPLDAFRQYELKIHAPLVAELPGLQRYIQGHTRDGFYTFGEARFDAVEQLWFADLDSLKRALSSDHFRTKVKASLDGFVDSTRVFTLAAKERWIIGPDERP